MGSYLALNLAQKGYKELYLVDYDDVEISNLNRQFFIERDLGDSKISALEKGISSFNSVISLRGFCANIEDLDVIDKVFQEFDCAALTADSSKLIQAL